MYNVFELWWVGKQKEFLLCTVHSKIYTAHTMLWFGTDQKTSFTNPTVSLFYVPQCTIQNRNVHISVLNGALWDMGQMHHAIC